MRKAALALTAISLLLVVLVVGLHSVNASPKTITVPDDYPTIESAIANANDGDIIFFKNGTYDGPIDQTLIIDKTLSLIGENVESTVLNLHPKYNVSRILTQSWYFSDDAITINANDVKLMDLTLSFMGNIRVNGDNAQIIGNDITAWATVTGLVIAGSNCNITNNVVIQQIALTGSFNNIQENSFSILFLESADRNFIDSNRIRYIQLVHSNDNTISNNNVSTNVDGYAVDLRNSINNFFNGNRVEVDRWNTDLKLESQSLNNTFYGNAFMGEDELVLLDATSEGNFWDNGVYGNFWSNYNGTDLLGDGIGDIPYIIDGNNQDHFPLMNPLSEGETFERPFPTVPIAISVAVVAAVAAGLLLYNRKRRKEAHQT